MHLSVTLRILRSRQKPIGGTCRDIDSLSLLSRMKAFFCALVLGLGLTLAGGGQGGGSTAPKGDVRDIAEAGGGGSTAPKGDVRDIA